MKLRQNKLVPLVLQELPGLPSSGSWSRWNSQEFERLIDRLESVREKWLQKQPQCGQIHDCLTLPENLLAEYSQKRNSSRISQVFAQANLFQSNVDRVIFIGTRDSHLILQTFLQACCDPYWNELTRGERGSKPRIYLAGDSLDNDATQGLLHLVCRDRPANRSEPFDWGVVSLKSCDAQDHQSLAEKHFQNQLHRTGNEAFFYRSLPNTSPDPTDLPPIPSALLAFSPMCLLPAAILGINIMELLAGASATSKLFASTSGRLNPILRWVAWNLTTENRTVALWNQSLVAGSRWICQLTNSLNSKRSNPADSWHFLQPLQEPIPDSALECCNHFWIDHHRFDDLHSQPDPIEETIWDPNSERPRKLQPNAPTSPSYNEIAKTSFEQTLQRQANQGGLGLTLHFPDLRELSLGQWMQWMIIASILQADLAQDT
ncbi:MAG: hypothetical protein ACKN82_02940 [Pirellula sp.]